MEEVGESLKLVSEVKTPRLHTSRPKKTPDQEGESDSLDR